MFGRRKRAPLGIQPAAVASAGVLTVAAVPGSAGIVRGWAPAGAGQSPTEQVGAFSGSAVTMRGGATLEVQRRQGVEGLSAGWMVPGRTDASTAWAITQQVGNQAAYLRLNGGNNGQLGPITARTMRQNVTAQAVRQSGLAAVQWAQSLAPTAGV